MKLYNAQNQYRQSYNIFFYFKRIFTDLSFIANLNEKMKVISSLAWHFLFTARGDQLKSNEVLKIQSVLTNQD